MCNKAKSTIVVGYIRVGRGQNSWKNREVGVNNQVGLVARNAMDCAKKTAGGKWRQRNGFLNHYLLLLTNVVLLSKWNKVCKNSWWIYFEAYYLQQGYPIIHIRGNLNTFFYSLHHLYIEHYVNIKVIISYYTTNNNNITPAPNIDYLYIK